MMNTANIPEAAALLDAYAAKFQELEGPAKTTSVEIAHLAAELR
jgi:hypothetical protein